MSKKVLYWALDVATVLAFLFVAWNIGHRYFVASTSRPTTTATSRVGEHLRRGALVALSDTNWAENRSTLILVLSTSCRFCKQSQPFYKRLINSTPTGKVYVIAVFPEPIAVTQPYLDAAGLNIIDVRQKDTEELGVEATPTIILADHRGHIASSWVGILSPLQEKEVFDSIGLHAESKDTSAADVERPQLSDGAKAISAAQLVQLFRNDSPLALVDVRDRNLYRQAHLTGFVNIPLDEMEERSHHELPANAPVVVYCNYVPACELKQSAQGSPTFCTGAAFLLHYFGYRDIRLVGEPLEDLQQKGLSVTDARNSFSSRRHNQHP